MRPQNYSVKTGEIAGVEITVTSYNIGEAFYCQISSADPGAVISRVKSSSSDEAVRKALQFARLKLSR